MTLDALLKFGHLVGLVLLGGGLAAVFVSEWRSYRVALGPPFVEAAWYTAIFYDVLVVPGAIMLGVTGYFRLEALGIGFFAEPWLVGMWGLFLFELIEGNTFTRLQFRRTLRVSREALGAGSPYLGQRNRARPLSARFAHFLDLPILTVIVWCGAARPASGLAILVAIALAIGAATLLTWIVPALARGRAALLASH